MLFCSIYSKNKHSPQTLTLPTPPATLYYSVAFYKEIIYILTEGLEGNLVEGKWVGDGLIL